MIIAEIVQFLETIAHPSLQEGYDNTGLLTGNLQWECTGVLVCLDSTEEIINEAKEKGANLVIAHHPIIFGGLKKINGKNYVERTIISAIKNDIAIYAIHTNLDNVLQGVSGKMAEKLELEKVEILQPKPRQLKKLIVFAPEKDAEKVREAIFAAGAGHIGNYSECSFTSKGTGSFKPEEGANPTDGEFGKRHTGEECKLEFIFPPHSEAAIIQAMKAAHSYEEVAYDVLELSNFVNSIGAGLIGQLKEPVSTDVFLGILKERFNLSVIKYTAFLKKEVQKVAICGGTGSFLTKVAIGAGADVFITGDVKYHEFFDADGKIVLADIGHYESEQFTMDLICELVQEKFINFAVRKTEKITNPVHYWA